MTGRVVVVTGTSTGVGKTIVTAALAVRAAGRGSVVVVKPVQTGIQHGDSDAREVHRLTGCPVQEYTALDEPLAPDTAARRQGAAIPPVAEYADRVRELAEPPRHRRRRGRGWAAGPARRRRRHAARPRRRARRHIAGRGGRRSRSRPGHPQPRGATVGALRSRGLEPAGLVIGSWPADPGLAESCNAEDLPHHTALPVLATIPEGVGSLGRAEFLAAAPTWFA